MTIDTEQRIVFLTSLSLETNWVPDTYNFSVVNGKLIYPLTEAPVEEKITQKNLVEIREYLAFQKIQTWATQHEEGIVAWISPPAPEYEYDSGKVIFSEILLDTSGNKQLFNRAILFNWDGQQCLNFASELDPKCKINSFEELRENPIFLTPETSQQLINILMKHTPEQTEMILTGKDIRIKEEIYRAISSLIYQSPRNSSEVYLFQQAQRMGLIGEHPASCSSSKTSAFNTMLESSKMMEGEKTLNCTCPFCNTRVEAVISGGRIQCPHCGKSAEYHC